MKTLVLPRLFISRVLLFAWLATGITACGGPPPPPPPAPPPPPLPPLSRENLLPLWKKAVLPGLLSDAEKKELCRQIEYILPAKVGKFAHVKYAAQYTDNARDDAIEITATDEPPGAPPKAIYKFVIRVIDPTPANLQTYLPAGAYRYRNVQDQSYTILAGRVEIVIIPLIKETALDSELRRMAYSFKLQELLNF
jgi:hypothetical protein